MSRTAKAYIFGVTLIGFTALGWALHSPQTSDPWIALYYSLLVAIAAALKVHLPGVTGTMSVSFVFILASMARLPMGAVLGVTFIACAVQTLWHAKQRPSVIQLLFNCGAMMSATAVGYWVFSQLAPPVPMVVRFNAAGAAYYLLNSFMIAIVIALTEGGSAFKMWRNCWLWSFPYHVAGATLAALMSVLEGYLDWAAALTIVPICFVIFRSYRLYLNQLQDEKKHAEEMASLHLRTIEALALAIEAKDQTTGTHLQRVQIYACEMAKELGLTKAETQALQAASILHDIGKLAIPDYIISKPGKLTPEEFEKMKIHPLVGAEILERINFPYPVVPIVRAHHEKWDGSGYPCGLKGQEIPIGARILSVVDTFDALASDRQYRKALPLAEAAEIVAEQSGKAFDPRVADLLVSRYPELEKLACGAVPTPRAALSTGVRVEHGAAPASGFEEGSVPRGGDGSSPDFLAAIAGARGEAQALYELTQMIGSSLSLTDTLSMVATRIQQLVPYEAIGVYVIRGSELHPAHTAGEDQRALAALRIPLGEGLAGWVAEHRKAILNGDPRLEPGFVSDPGNPVKLKSAVAVPLETGAGVIGVLVLYGTSKNAFSRDHLRILLAINSKLSVVVENSLSYQDAASKAVTDGLTGLPNASSLFLQLDTEVSRCKRNSGIATVLVCDLDGFKAVNDRFGHLAGNQVLKAVADGFRACCRKHDFVARMGGDEFVLILPNASPQTLESKIEHLSQVVVAAGRALSEEAVLGVSIGLAHYPDDGTGAEMLLAAADQRMYRAKHGRKLGHNPDAAELLRLSRQIEAATFDSVLSEIETNLTESA